MSVSIKDKTINQWSRDDLMGLPVRKWDAESEYDSVLLLSTRKKHESGWAKMAIIGVRGGQPVEIAGSCCDDIEWKLPPMTEYSTHSIGQMRMDCVLRAGAMHAWSKSGIFRVRWALSSMTIELIQTGGENL
jgi:hypothetical protein